MLVHTLDLLEQMQENVRHWLGVSPGIIGGGRWDPRETITVATVQTLIRRKKELPGLVKQFGTLLLDEAHHVPAATFTGIIQKFPAKYRYGLSATPEREDGLHPFLYAVMGPLRAQVTPENLERAGPAFTASSFLDSHGFQVFPSRAGGFLYGSYGGTCDLLRKKSPHREDRCRMSL